MMRMRNNEGYFDPTASIAIRNIERAEKRMNSIRRGEIFYIEKFATTGSEQSPGRPALVVSNDMCNEYSDVIEVVYLTTAPKTDLPTHVTIRSTPKPSIALCEQISSVSKTKVGNYMCSASQDEMTQIDIALMTSLDLYIGSPKEEAKESPKREDEPKKEVAQSAPPVPTSAEELKKLKEMELENQKLQTALEIYKGLYADMLERVMGVSVH